MNDVWLTIPTGGRSQYLESIIEGSGLPRNRVIIVNTTPQQGLTGCHNLWSERFNIHHWWNLGIEHAKANGARYVVVSNDDVRIGPGSVQKIVEVMRASGAQLGTVNGTEDHIVGWFWVLDVESDIRPDESYAWWYGDNDLYQQANKILGNVVYVDTDVEHLHPNELTETNPKLLTMTKFDERLWLRRQL